MFKKSIKYYLLLVIPYVAFSFTDEHAAKFKKGDRVLAPSGDAYIIEGPSPNKNTRASHDIIYCAIRVRDSRRDCRLPESDLKLDTNKRIEYDN